MITPTDGPRLWRETRPYEIQSPLGAGGMGEVYRARDTRLDRTVAVKILPESFASDADRLQRFEHEARILSALNHPNLLSHFRCRVRKDGTHYLVSEFLEGQTLRQRLNLGPLPARRATDYALQIANGMSAAYDKGVVHRDLKPDNVFVTRDERVKILDFGLAKQTHAAEVSADGLTLTSPTPTAGGHGFGYRGIHVARASPRAHASRPSLRHFQLRRHPLRDGLWAARLQRRLEH